MILRRQGVGTDLVLLGLGAAVLFAVSLGARDLWNPNEPTYGLAVAEMAERGDWLVPTVGERIFPEKPILYYWLALAASGLLGGVNELTLRLPLALGGVMSVLLVYLLVRPYAGSFRTRLSAALYATIFMVYWGARSVQMDFLVTVTTLGAVYFATRVLDHGASAWRGWLLAGAAAGLGVLAKGPVGLLLPLIVMALHRLASRMLQRDAPATKDVGGPKILALLVGLAVCILVAAPWYIALFVRGHGDFAAEVLYRQSFVRYVRAWDHIAPWWYYLKYFWIDMAPWAWFVPLAVALPGRGREARGLDRLAWCWIAAVLIFFSLSQSKRSAYILPLAPAVAILAAAVAESMLNGTLPRWRRRICLGLLSAIGLALLVGAAVAHGRLVARYPEMSGYVLALTFLLVLGGTVVLLSWLRPARAHVLAPSAFFGFVVALYLTASVALLPAADRYKSARGFSGRVNRLVAADSPLAAYGLWKWRAAYAYYAGRKIPNLLTPRQLRDYWASGEPVFLIVEDERVPEARDVLGNARPLVEKRIGSRTAFLFSNR